MSKTFLVGGGMFYRMGKCGRLCDILGRRVNGLKYNLSLFASYKIIILFETHIYIFRFLLCRLLLQ